jgi:hypothetical protein
VLIDFGTTRLPGKRKLSENPPATSLARFRKQRSDHL